MTVVRRKGGSRNGFSKLKKGGTYIVLITPERYRQGLKEIVMHLTGRLKLNGIYVSLNTPYSTLLTELSSKGINTSQLYFIDGISKKSSSDVKADNAHFLQSPSSLTELSIVLTHGLNIGEINFVLMDSLSTMLLYNKQDLTERFFHFIAGKLKSFNVTGIIMILDEERSRKLMPVLSQICDATITL